MKVTEPNYNLFGIDFESNNEQVQLIKAIQKSPYRKPIVFCYGNAGTGKTFCALAAALDLVRRSGARDFPYEQIYYLREPVEVGHRLGFLKGGEEEKYAPYLGPILDNYESIIKLSDQKKGLPFSKKKNRNISSLSELPSEYRRLPSDIIPLVPEFVRGRTFDDSIILVDEAQNLNLHEIHTLCTRIGKNTKMVFLGSLNQIDCMDKTVDKNPFELAYEILEPTKYVTKVVLKKSMRSPFVAEIDDAFTNYRKLHNKQ